MSRDMDLECPKCGKMWPMSDSRPDRRDDLRYSGGYVWHAGCTDTLHSDGEHVREKGQSW